ncbi:MAG: carcinine hydrolase/isopenicillin-N N-acyltransferase family protein, partial [Anaerolineae bacterium]
TENSMLARFTAVTAFHQDQRPFITVGWPGFVGALSGVAAGRFAVTLNAVLSEEPVQMATPISLYIRTVLEEAETSAQAVDMLAQEPIVSDCLLLVCGTKPGEMVVIERTPTRAALRKPEDGYIAVTNTYRLLNSVMVTPGTLAATTDARFETTCARLEAKLPTTPDTCFEILEAVRLPITVQQMVLRPSDGTALVRPAG